MYDAPNHPNFVETVGAYVKYPRRQIALPPSPYNSHDFVFTLAPYKLMYITNEWPPVKNSDSTDISSDLTVISNNLTVT